MVDEIIPPITTVASGRCTSEPAPTLKAIGMKPRLATSAVMRTGQAGFCDVSVHIGGIVAPREAFLTLCFEFTHGFAERTQHRRCRNFLRHDGGPESLARGISKKQQLKAI